MQELNIFLLFYLLITTKRKLHFILNTTCLGVSKPNIWMKTLEQELRRLCNNVSLVTQTVTLVTTFPKFF